MQTKHVAVYARISSSSQNLDAQVGELENWISIQPFKDNVIWYKDVASGTTMARPAMEKLLKAIAQNKVHTIVLWRLDRLGRTASKMVSLLHELFQRKINLISLRDSLDLSTPAGRLMANVLSSVAAYENEVRNERQAIGIERAKQLGKYTGGKKGRKCKVTNEHEKVVKQMYSDGNKIAAISRITKLSRPTIYKIISL
jgi:DNA invertase Pin-like site-specific DNA recombinase